MGPDGVTMQQFVEAFGKECAVYVGGDRNQDQPATLIHGIADLDGATEISPGTNIYRGGFQAAVDGVLSGKYTPLEFRFFVGSCEFHESQLDIDIRLGKVQPVACARSVALKQCISLPKPLWHEVLELCGGQLAHISSFELMKRDDLPHPKGREGVDVTRRADGYELQITKEMMTKALKRLADNGELAPDATFEDLTEAEKTRVAQILLAEANSDDQWDDDAGEKDEEDSAWE
uniref:Uncharacterized protein n=1 Tax=Craspedostauros australis TaxID=1486917 RepID=A0A7R9WM29_9STRA